MYVFRRNAYLEFGETFQQQEIKKLVSYWKRELERVFLYENNKNCDHISHNYWLHSLAVD